jgi:ribosomal protein S18 acetylase RimI-like enzyme
MFSIRVMTMDDYDAITQLMSRTPGITRRDADSRGSTAAYLQRNPGLSFVAESKNQLCGCIMSGHDGRRGYLQHLLVLPDFRRHGIGRALVERCLYSLQILDIHKCHVDVLVGNPGATQFWQRLGWQLRGDIERYSFTPPGRENA